MLRSASFSDGGHPTTLKFGLDCWQPRGIQRVTSVGNLWNPQFGQLLLVHSSVMRCFISCLCYKLLSIINCSSLNCYPILCLFSFSSYKRRPHGTQCHRLINVVHNPVRIDDRTDTIKNNSKIVPHRYTLLFSEWQLTISRTASQHSFITICKVSVNRNYMHSISIDGELSPS